VCFHLLSVDIFYLSLLKFSLKLCEIKILDGWQVYYNYIRPNQALLGHTPAEASGIDLKLGENKWLSLIKKSSEK